MSVEAEKQPELSKPPIEELLAEREELVHSLPEELHRYLEVGCSISRSKATGAWNLQTRKIVPNTKTVPKEWAPVVERIKQLGEELAQARSLGAAEAEADAETQSEIRVARKDARQPIVEKEIEDAAWFHNLLHDLGKYTYHRLVKKVEWGEDEIADYEAAFKRLSARVDALLEMEQDAELLERLQIETVRLEAIAFTYKDLWERASESLRIYKWYTDLLIASMDLSSRQRALNQIVASSAIRVAPEALAGGAS